MENTQATGFRAEIKLRISDIHRETQNLPYIKALLQNDLPKIAYVGYLKGMAIVYGALEQQLLGQDGLILKPYLNNYLRKLPLLLADLESLDGCHTPDILPAVGQALGMADTILVHSVSRPYTLLGYLYALDGALNGGSILKRHVTISLGLSGETGIRYFSSFGYNSRDFWMNYLQLLDSKLPDDSAKEAVIEGAVEAFKGLTAFYGALYPIDEASMGIHITSLNPESGHLPITTDPHEIEAAIKAGLACWNHYPFFEERFGERGRRFAISDAAWLIGLSEIPLDMAADQARWLANFLSIKGMPSIIIEMQLHTLHHELGQRSPHNKPRYKHLLEIAKILKSDRLGIFDQSTFIEADRMFETQLQKNNVTNRQLLQLALHMGSLMASSLADAALGQQVSRSAMRAWLTDESLFPPTWIAAVEATYQMLESHRKSAPTQGKRAHSPA